MAGPWVKSAVPRATRQLMTPATGVPAMPISTGTTAQWAAAAMRQTLVRRAARFSSTARVTLASVWLTPWATTPLSAHSTNTARLARSGVSVPIRAAASSTIVSSRPRPPRGLASAAQWACAAARAALLGDVTVFNKVFSSFSVMVLPLYSGRPRSQSVAARVCPPSTGAEIPHTNVRWRSRRPSCDRWF